MVLEQNADRGNIGSGEPIYHIPRYLIEIKILVSGIPRGVRVFPGKRIGLRRYAVVTTGREHAVGGTVPNHNRGRFICFHVTLERLAFRLGKRAAATAHRFVLPLALGLPVTAKV